MTCEPWPPQPPLRRADGARRVAAWLVAGVLVFLSGVDHAAADTLGLPALTPPPQAHAALGHKLFFDRRLSVNATLSCAMCHVPAQAFTSNELRTSVGIEGISLRRNAPSLLNVAHVRRLFLDGRAGSLETQALQPLVHPDEMANPNIGAAMRRIDALPDYRAPMREAFGAARATPARVAAALAAYQRTLIAADSPFDRWRYGGQQDAMDAAAQRGFALFQDLGCAGCHTVGAKDALFSDGEFYNVGVRTRSDARRSRAVEVQLIPGQMTQVTPEELRRIGVDDAPDRGRHEVTRKARDLRAFRTPSLRNVAMTAPYMHDGSLDTLDDVLDHYIRGGAPGDRAQDPRIRPFALDASQRQDLIAFLHALTSPAVARLGQSAP